MARKKCGLTAGVDSILKRFADKNKALVEQMGAMLTPRVELIKSSREEAQRLYANVADATWEDAIAYVETNPPSPVVICALIFASQKAAFTERGRAGAEAMRRNTAPVVAKTNAKSGARELWKERYAGKHPLLKTNEQFAIKVMSLWPVLKSSKVICGWCTDWEKEAKANRTPVC